jgi:AcrR family transcriptional regulator
MGMKRMTRDERRAVTRTELLDAAARVFARRGFHGASVDEVAAEAGYTSGAVYSHFAGKDDLFLAAFEHDVAHYVTEMTEAREKGETPEERTRALATRWMEILRRRPEMFMLVIEYWTYAVRDPKMREQFAERFGAFRDTTARMIEDEVEITRERRPDWALPEAPEDLALGINALVYGVALQYMAAPEEMPDDLLARIVGLIFAAIRDWNEEQARSRRPPLTNS